MAINLMPWRAERRKQFQKNFLIRLGMAAAAGVVMVVISAVILSGSISGQSDRNAYLQKEIDRAEKDIEAIDTLEQRRDALLARKDVIERLQGSRDQIAHLFYELARHSMDGIKLTGMTHKAGVLEVEGLSTSNSSVAVFLRSLDTSGWVVKPEVVIIQNKNAGQASAVASTDAYPYSFKVKMGLKNPNLPEVSEENKEKPASAKKAGRDRSAPAKTPAKDS